MTQTQWAASNYTDSTSLDLNGTIYSDETFDTAFDATSYTATFQIIDPYKDVVRFSSTSGLTVNADGTFAMAFTSGANISILGQYKVRLILEKSGNYITVIGINNSSNLYIN